MADANRGMILWTLGGSGVFLLYAAYKNQSPQTLLMNHLTGAKDSQPIVKPTAVSTATDSNGKTWNTEPGSGGWATTDPPLPGDPSGSGYANQLQSAPQSVARDLSGVYNVIDSNGLVIAQVPQLYQKSPATYIPQVTT